MSDAASIYSFSSTTPLTTKGAAAPKSVFRRFFSSSSAGVSKPASSSSDAPYDAFAEIMALNARHGHPSVQAHFVKSSPRSTKLKSSAGAAVPEPKPSAPYDAFTEIMRLNAKHGHPSVQAHYVR